MAQRPSETGFLIMVRADHKLNAFSDMIRADLQTRPSFSGALWLHSATDTAAFIGRSIAQFEKVLTHENAARDLALISLLAVPPISFLMLALRPNPRQIWAQRWPTIAFIGLYQIALDRCVEIEGLENLPETGPVILAGNHINKTSMDGMLLGSKILVQRGIPAKWVSIADPPDRMLRHFVRMLGSPEGILLPIHKGTTTRTMIEFLRNPEAFQRTQSILGIFPVGEADSEFEKQMSKPWHTSAAVAAVETGAAIVPFWIAGLPYHWGPLDIVKAVARSVVGEPAFKVKIRVGPPIQITSMNSESNYQCTMERLRQAVRSLSQ